MMRPLHNPNPRAANKIDNHRRRVVIPHDGENGAVGVGMPGDGEIMRVIVRATRMLIVKRESICEVPACANLNAISKSLMASRSAIYGDLCGQVVN